MANINFQITKWSTRPDDIEPLLDYIDRLSDELIYAFRDVETLQRNVVQTGDTINVNGSFKSQGLLKVASEISVDGSVTGDKIETGTMKVNGSLRCEETKADLIILGKHSRARGTLIAKKVILKKGAKAETVIADEVELGSRARVTNLQAKIVNEEEYTEDMQEEY